MPDFVADGAIDDDTVTDAVVLPDIVREAVRVTLAVNDIVPLCEAVIERDAVAPIVSEDVDVAVGVAVSELDAVIVAETLYEGDDAHHAGIAG